MSDSGMSEWKPSGRFRVVLSDGTLWSESSNEDEVRASLERIRREWVKVHFGAGSKIYGPDPDAVFEQRWERSEHEWRAAGSPQ